MPPSQLPVPPPRRRRSLSVTRPGDMASSIKVGFESANDSDRHFLCNQATVGNFFRRHSSAKVEAKAPPTKMTEQPKVFIERPASRVPEQTKPVLLQNGTQRQHETAVQDRRNLTSVVNGNAAQTAVQTNTKLADEWTRSSGRGTLYSSATSSDLSAEYTPHQNGQQYVSVCDS